MSLLRLVVVAFATVFLFAGFAAAGKDDHPHGYDDDDYHPKIWGPKCYDKKWEWVCILSFLSFILWLISDLLALCLDIQFSWSSPVQGRSVPAVNMLWWR